MTSRSCAQIRPLLGPLVDGELSGADMLRASGHLEACGDCARDFADLQALGDELRESAADTVVPAMAGLADGVVTRVRAEQEQSWRRTCQRAVDDWHWAIVGVGSVASTATIAVVLAAMLMLGPGPERSDSLAAVLEDLGQQATWFVVLERGQDWDGFVGSRPRGYQSAGGVARAAFLGATERELVSLLSERLSWYGPGVDLSSMSEHDRRYTEALLDQINSIRSSTTRVLMVDSTTVNASGP